jgi:hypothetical protein
LGHCANMIASHECVRLAGLTTDHEIRDRLLNIVRKWMDTALRELLAGSLARPSPIAGRLRAGRLHQKRDAECCLRQQFPHTETKTYPRNASILRGFKRTSHFGRWRGLAAAAGFETPHQYRPVRSLAGSTVNRLCATLRANSLDCEGSPGECWIPVPLPPPTPTSRNFSGLF